MDTNTTTAPKRRLTLASWIAVALALGGALGWGLSTALDHGSSDSAAGPLADSANRADIAFAQMMVPHHEQALQMARLAAARADSSAVKKLAADIEAAQQPEIDTLNAMLEAWGVGSMAGMSGMPGMHHGAMDMGQGMMSQADLDSLKGESGSAFDREFLSMMVQHHQGAIRMAETELSSGKNAAALALARSIQVTQQAEVASMKGLLR